MEAHTPHPTDETAWGLIASAIAGRRLEVVRANGETSYTDGTLVYLGDGARIDSVVVQAAMLAVGSLDPALVARLVARRGSRGRYVTLEVVRAMRVLEHTVPRSILERVREVYEGQPTASAAESLKRADSTWVPQAPDWFGTIRPLTVLRAGGLNGTDVDEDKLAKATSDSPHAIDELAGDDDSFEHSRILDLLSSPISNSLASRLASKLGMQKTLEPGVGGGEELSLSGNRMARPSGKGRLLRAPSWLRVHTGTEFPVGRWYPEWSCDQHGYRENWCAVAEFDPRVGAHTAPTTDRPDPALRHQLARLGLANEVHRRQADGDGLDLTALVDNVIDRATGGPEDARVYESRKPTARGLGALILLDATGSTGESTDGRQVFEQQRTIVDRLTAVLDELGDRVATFGFVSYGRENVRFLRIKGFDDRFDRGARRRLASLEPGGYTRLGAAIRHGTHLVSTTAGTSSMLLVIVGDGLPYDDDGYEDRYAFEDTRLALSESVARGVGCACISTSSATEERVMDRVWGHVAHRRLDDPVDLARHVRPLFRDALREAAASRRLERGPDRSRAFAAP